jgi:phosphoglycerate dehydrogenase-like enzyme
MRVIAWSQNLTGERANEVGVDLAPSLGSLLEQADIATIHLVLSNRTRGLIGADELSRMPRHATLVNTSRGPIVDEPALIDALGSGAIAGAALDVFEREPLPLGHALRDLGNVVLTPHIGYVTRENYELFYGGAVEDILAYLDGAPLRVVTPPS